MRKMTLNATKGFTAAMAITVAAFGLATVSAAEPSEAVRKWRDSCMQETGNEPLCACMANALQTHVPKEHITHKEGGVEFSAAMSEEAHDKVTKAALECQTKFEKQSSRRSN